VTDSGRIASRLWREIRTVTETGSTNADLLAAARAGEPEGLVLVARSQTAGRGRLGRQWQSPPGTGLTFSVLLRPAEVPPASLGWLPLLTGVAVAVAVTGVSAVPTRLKWPNDVLAGRAKLGGILAEAWDSAVVIGAGINVSQRRDELPATATSLSLAAAAGQPVSPRHLLDEVLARLAHWYLAWRDQPSPGDADACGLRAEYLSRCATVGQEVTVMLPDGQSLSGRASGVDPAGQLEVITATGPVQVSAGDVVHVRPAGGQGGQPGR
jgi:BirA family transcriptional regulator, biotin operon repressor / biotin---[acetyl-CoA-carboxylase] ligase